MDNAGIKEKGRGAYDGTLTKFHAYRAKGAPIGFAPDPRWENRYIFKLFENYLIRFSKFANPLELRTANLFQRTINDLTVQK